MADEYETMMSATLRFPFQASLDGYSMVETDGDLYYGLDLSLEPVELPAQVFSISKQESNTEAGLGLRSDDDHDDEEDKQQQGQHSNSEDIFHPLGRDIVVKIQEQERGSEDVAPRPVSVSMHPHRIDTSDQQRFATDHEMAATEAAEEEKIICESPSSSTLDATETEQESTTRVSVPSSRTQQSIPRRYYATPLIKDDLTTTPVAIYGLEKPSDHVAKKKAVTMLRQRGISAVAPVRPSSRHQRQFSPLSAVNHDNHVEEQARTSTSSARGLSLFLGRIPTSAVPSAVVSRPTIGSISSSGSSATTATMRSRISAVSDVSTTTSISTSSSPTVDANQKPVEPPSDSTTTPNHNQATSSFARPQPLRQTTVPISSFKTNHIPLTGADTHRKPVFNFSMPKYSSSMMYHRAGIQSSDNLTTIRAVTDDQVTIHTADAHPFHDSSREASSSSKQMPFSPDSFLSPHTYSPSDSNAYNNKTSFSQINRPTRYYHDQNPPAISNAPNPQYQAYPRNNQQPRLQLGKQDESDHHQHRASSLFTRRMFVTDLDQKA